MCQFREKVLTNIDESHECESSSFKSRPKFWFILLHGFVSGFHTIALVLVHFALVGEKVEIQTKNWFSEWMNKESEFSKPKIIGWLTIGTMCPVKLYVIGWPSNGSVSVHSSSSPSHKTLYAISTPNIIRNIDPTTVYNMYKKKYRWFAKPTQLFSQAEKRKIQNVNASFCS